MFYMLKHKIFITHQFLPPLPVFLTTKLEDWKNTTNSFVSKILLPVLTLRDLLLLLHL